MNIEFGIKNLDSNNGSEAEAGLLSKVSELVKLSGKHVDGI